MRERIYQLIEDERKRQDEKWGEQNHPITTLSESYAASVCEDTREYCEKCFKVGKGSWLQILEEEVYESVAAAASGDVDHTYEELVQTAAVVVAMIECLERNGLHGAGVKKELDD